MNKSDKENKIIIKERKIKDYSIYRNGDTDPSTGKIIGALIMNAHEYIVYLDKELRIEWGVTDDYETPSHPFSDLFGEVVTKVIELEGLSETFQLPKHQLREYRTLLGGAIFTMLEREKPHIIREVLKKADSYLKDRMAETARTWYLLASVSMLLVTWLIVLLLGLVKGINNQFLGGMTYDILLGMAMGAVGALISIMTRSNKLLVNVSAGKKIHYFEGAVRVIVGMLGAVLVGLAVKADIFLGLVNTAKEPLAVLLGICGVAGASERMVPSLIKRVEGMVDKPEAQDGTNKGQSPKAREGEE